MRRWLLPRGVRVSLTMWYVGVMMVVLTAYALVVFAFVRRSLSNSLDERLRDDFEWAEAMAELQPDGTLRWFDGESDGGDDTSLWLTVWRDGKIIFRTAVAERNPLPESATSAMPPPGGRIVVVPLGQSMVRVLRDTATVHGVRLMLEVARTETSMRLRLHDLMMLFLLSLPLGVAAAGAGGYLLARRALAPIDRMASLARTITAERLSDRLPVANRDDELGRLATVFNDTLGRLELSFADMRRFTSDVSHELRTPLTAMRSVGEVGLRGRRDPQAYRAVIGSMLEEVDRLSTVIDRLLTLSRAGTLQRKLPLEPVDLCELADDVVTQLAVLAEEKQQSILVEAQGVSQGLGDRVMLRQAVINLVDNAIKYTQDGGRIRIRVWESSTAAMLEVYDNGPGIPEASRQRIFERFYRVEARGRHAAVGGSGLGLSIAKWAIEANGGVLSYELREGGGSTFRVGLARARRAEFPAVLQFENTTSS